MYVAYISPKYSNYGIKKIVCVNLTVARAVHINDLTRMLTIVAGNGMVIPLKTTAVHRCCGHLVKSN